MKGDGRRKLGTAMMAGWLPAPPHGRVLDPGKVNVVLGVSGQGPRTLPRATGPDHCGAEPAWFFDDARAPTRIELCPALCDELKSASAARIEIMLGCATQVVIGPRED